MLAPTSQFVASEFTSDENVAGKLRRYIDHHSNQQIVEQVSIPALLDTA
jgi:hypothetical protein